MNSGIIPPFIGDDCSGMYYTGAPEMRKLLALPFLCLAFLHPACCTGCSSDGQQLTMKDVATSASIAGATNATAHIQLQNRPASIGAEQSFYIDSGVDAAISLTFDGRNVDQETLFKLIDELDATPSEVNTNAG